MIVPIRGFMPRLDRRLSIATKSGNAATIVPSPTRKPSISDNSVFGFPGGIPSPSTTTGTGAISTPAIALVPDSNLPCGRRREFLHAHCHRRGALPAAASLSGGTRFFAHSIGPYDHAASAWRHVQQVLRRTGAAAAGLPGAPRFQHRHPWPASFSVRYHRRWYTCLADRASGFRLRNFYLDAIHQHEHTGLRRPSRT